MGGGPSSNYRVYEGPKIVTNMDIARYDDAEYFVTCDITFLKLNSTEIRMFKGTKFFVNDADQKKFERDDLRSIDVFINTIPRQGFGTTWNKVNTGCNSGYTAVQIAILLGFKEIHMHGIDLVHTERSHWHRGYGHPKHFLEQRFQVFFDKFKESIPNAPEDIRFISHSKISRLNEIKRVEVA